ncbi:hypothetical protein G9A89_005097 [Geosiphon pyriformis]|nr:hypothetical protein G9A89_005097 [Geosiphon pyriformis]
MASSDLSLVTVAGRILLVCVCYFWVGSWLLGEASSGFESFGVDRLLAVVVDTLPVAVADKLGPLVDKLALDILVVDKLIAALLASK